METSIQTGLNPIIQKKAKPSKLQSYFILFQIQAKQQAISKFPILNVKNDYCKHKDGCIINAISGYSKSFAIAYSLKIAFSMINFLLTLKKKGFSVKEFFKIFIHEDNIRFGIFPGLYALIKKFVLAVLCGGRHISQEDTRYISFIAGFLAGFISLSCLKQGSRMNWALYLFARALDTLFISMQNRKIIKRRSCYYVFLLAFCALCTAYAFGQEIDALPPYMQKFYGRFGNEEKAEIQFRNCWQEKKRLDLIKSGVIKQ